MSKGWAYEACGKVSQVFSLKWPEGGDSSGCKKRSDCLEVYEKKSHL